MEIQQVFTVNYEGRSGTFKGDRHQAWDAYMNDEMANKNMVFLDWCSENLERVDVYGHILTDEYLTSLGYKKLKQDDNHFEWERITRNRDERLLYSVWRDGVFLAIVHRTGKTFPRGVFSGKIPSREIFEIILNCVA
jgi:hypothetical protein